MRRVLLAAGFCFLFSAPPAQAGCAGPAGDAGDVMYNADWHVPQYCNGGAWVAMGMTGVSQSINSGLLHYWNLDEAPGAATAVDSAGTMSLSKTGTADFTTSGQVNNALNLPDDATQKYFSAATPADMLGKSKLTLSAWMKRAVPNGFVDVGQEDPDNSGDEISIEMHSDGNIYLSISNAAAPQTYGHVNTTNPSVNDVAWHMVTLVFDGTQATNATRLKGYLDGVQQTIVFDSTPIPAVTTSTSRTFYIGNLGGGYNDAGAVDEVRIYGRALTSQDVLDLYNWSKSSVVPAAGLVNHWKFDELTGPTAADSAGGSNNGTLINGASFSASGIISNALFLNASDDGDDTNNPQVDLGTAYNITGTNLTFAAWVNPTNYNDWRSVMGRRAIQTDEGLLHWQLQTSSGTVLLQSTTSNVGFGYAPPTGTWTHLAIVTTPTESDLYVNGVFQEAQGGFVLGACPGCHATIGDNGEVLNGGFDSDPFKGYIDDLRIYNRDLSPGEILSLYKNSGANRACSNPAGTEGDIIYSAGTRHVLQFCGVSGWQALGPVPGSGGGGCGGPSGVEGDIRYNGDKSVMQYCDGTNWRQMPSASYIPLTDLMAYWKLDESAGASATDYSGNGRTLSLFNAPIWNPASGHNSGMLQFNGTTQYGATAATLDLTTTNAATVTMWLNYTYTLSGNGPELFEFSDNFNNYSDSFIMWDSQSTCPGLAIANRAIVVGLKGDAGYNIACFNPPTDNAWHHLAAVVDTSQAAAEETKLYIDGVLQTETGKTFNNDNTNNFGNRTLFLQSRNGATDFAAGKVDDVRVYKRALTAEEIRKIYNGS